MFQDLSSFQGYTWEVTNDWSNVNGYFVYIQVYIAGHLGHLMEIWNHWLKSAVNSFAGALIDLNMLILNFMSYCTVYALMMSSSVNLQDPHQLINYTKITTTKISPLQLNDIYRNLFSVLNSEIDSLFTTILLCSNTKTRSWKKDWLCLWIYRLLECVKLLLTTMYCTVYQCQTFAIQEYLMTIHLSQLNSFVRCQLKRNWEYMYSIRYVDVYIKYSMHTSVQYSMWNCHLVTLASYPKTAIPDHFLVYILD